MDVDVEGNTPMNVVFTFHLDKGQKESMEV